MTVIESAAPQEAGRMLPVLRRVLGASLSAVYLHGSAVAGGLKPISDVDLLAVINAPMTQAQRLVLGAEMLKVSGRPRPIELIVFEAVDLDRAACPARAAFVYGEWLREDFERGRIPEPEFDPEFTLLLAQARREARPLLGPAVTNLLPPIAESDVRRATVEALPRLMSGLNGDERNVLLTLARMWFTLETGTFASKDEAAWWAGSRLDGAAAAVLDLARMEYLGGASVGWSSRSGEVREAAAELHDRVMAAA